MRSHEERVAETKRRIAARQREKRLRRNTITMVLSLIHISEPTRH